MFGLSLAIDKFDVRYIYHLFDQWQKAFSLAAEGPRRNNRHRSNRRKARG
jgi:hypothetical protein